MAGVKERLNELRKQENVVGKKKKKNEKARN